MIRSLQSQFDTPQTTPRLRRWFVFALAGATLSAGACALYARVEWPWLLLGWVGLVPWLAVLDRTPTLGRALGAALLMCVAFVLAVFGWFAAAMQSYTAAPWSVAVFALVLLAPLLQPQFVGFALARHLARRGAGRGGRPQGPPRRATNQTHRGDPPDRSVGFWRVTLVGACAYVGTEWAVSKLFADTIGHGLYASPLMRQAADLGGAPGLTFVLIVANECVLATSRTLTTVLADRHRGSRRPVPAFAWAPAVCAVTLVVALLAYGSVRLYQLGRDTRRADRVTVGVIQADISQYDRMAAELGTFEAVRTILDAHFSLSADVLRRGDIDMLVWPETVYPTTFGTPKSPEGAAFDREIGAFVAHSGVPLVFGAYDVDGHDEFNAAVLLEPSNDGRLRFDTYRKATLFPLTERVPALLESAAVRRWLPWLGTWRPGNSPPVIPLRLRDGRTLRIAPLICYDAVDPSRALAAARQGAEMIVTLSNDSWFAAGGGPHLHLVVSAFRSIETRRPQIRATNTGISAVIDATGEMLDGAAVHTRASLVAAVTPERSATTLMLAWGDWFGPTALACGVALLGATVWRGVRR